MKRRIVSIVLAFVMLLPCISGNVTHAEAANKRPLANGVYVIESSLNFNKAVDVNGASRANCAKIQLWSKNRSVAQSFKFTYNNGSYIIRNVNSGKVLDVEGGIARDSQRVIQYDYHGGNNQRWILEPAGGGASGGFYRIRSAMGNYYLDVQGAGTGNGTQIQIYHGNGTAAQRFYLQSTVEYTYKTVTISNPTSIADWIAKERKARGSIDGIGYLGNVQVALANSRGYSKCIVSSEILQRKKVRCFIPTSGPSYNGSSPGRYVYINFPTKIRYRIHQHNVELDTTERQLGTVLGGIAQLKFSCIYTCSCGLSYTTEWEFPFGELADMNKYSQSSKAYNLYGSSYQVTTSTY